MNPIIYQFWDRRFRKHDCGLCSALVARNRCEAHAQYHFQNGERPGPPNHNTTLAVLEITVEPDGRAHRTAHGCWQMERIG